MTQKLLELGLHINVQMNSARKWVIFDVEIMFNKHGIILEKSKMVAVNHIVISMWIMEFVNKENAPNKSNLVKYKAFCFI